MSATGHIRKRENKKGEECYQIIVETPSDRHGKRNRIYRSIQGTRKQAEALLRQTIAEVEEQSYIKPTKLTVGEWIHQWMELYVEGKRSPTTIEGYKNQVEKYIIPALGNVYLQDLTPAMVQKWVNQLRQSSPRTGKPLSPKTIRNIWLNLSSAMERAVIDEVIKKNPCEHTELPSRERYEAKVFDQSEIQSFLSAVSGTDLEVPMLIEICLGLRRGELLGLKWKHIDFEHSKMTICENLVSVGTELITKTPKTRSGIRTLEIPASLLEKLAWERKKYLEHKLKLGADFHDGDYVVCKENGDPYTPDYYSLKYRRFIKSHGLKQIRFHDLRHTNATLMLEQGISPKVAQQRLGHADFSTTMNIYSHVLESVDKQAADTIDKAVFQSIHSA